jgi:Fe-S cluster biogenesis protein NfuA
MKKISAPESISADLKKFVDDKSISIDIVSDGGDLKIEDTGAERLESSLSILYSGGWTTCATARATAKKLEITLPQMGEMLDHLNVKVRQCGLGCF